MAAISDNKYDVYNWIIKVINSCKTQHQYNSTEILILNFRKMYEDHQLASPLWNYLHIKKLQVK